MAGETTITVIGNLTDAPALRFTPAGVAMARFTVASTPRMLDRESGKWRDGDPLFMHVEEGADDMPAHVRSALTATQLSIPVLDGALALGTWQGIYLWEHRLQGHTRNLVVHVLGE